MGGDNLPRMTLRFNGLFDFDGLYQAITDWAKNYGYMWHEAAYKHKVPSPTGAEQEYTWILSKNVTYDIQYEIMITVHSWDMLEVEVDQDGKKKSLTNGRLYIWLNSKIAWEWMKPFDKKKGVIAEKLGKWYGKVFGIDRDLMWEQLYYRTWNLHSIIKKYFDLQTKKYAYKKYLGEH